MENTLVTWNYDDTCDVKVVDIKNVHTLLAEDEVNFFDMTSLKTLLLLGQTSSKISDESKGETDDDTNLHRLSLAYERLGNMPTILTEHVATHVRILDISNNEFKNLDFLNEFSELTHLICDHNNITSKTGIPFLPTLELLWMNHCKITELYPWSRRLLHSCPNLRYLSLMGNPIAPSFFGTGNFLDYLQYRLFLISLFPYLIHLDDKAVTADERKQADEMYHRPLVERLVMRTHRSLPPCLREVSEMVSDMLAPIPPFMMSEKNVVI